MKAATTDELAEALQVLFAALPSSNAGEATELRMRAYLLALDGIPAVALRDAVTRILKGTAGLDNPKFVPTPPELAKLCRACSAQYSRQLERLGWFAAKARGEVAFTPSKETRERISQGFQKLSDALGPIESRQPERKTG